MATSTVLTNKPINPRGDDNRPVDSYNRASLYSGKALDFDGVNDSVSVGTLSGDVYAATFLTYTDVDITAATSTQTLINFATGSGNWAFKFGASTGFLTDETFSILLPNSARVGIDKTIPKGWNSWAVCWDGSTYKIYQNGQEQQTITSGTASVISMGLVELGKELSGQYYNGSLSNVKVFSTALTAAQVSDLYNNPEKIVPTGVSNTALKLWLPMMEGAGTTAYDGSGNGNHGTISGATYVHGIGAPVSQTAVISWNKGSNNIGDHAWDASAVSNNSSISTSSHPAPNEVETAFIFDDGTANTYHRSYKQASCSAGEVTASVFVKKKDVDYINVVLGVDGGSTKDFALVDLVNGTINDTSGNPTATSMQSVGDGWYYVSVQETHASGNAIIYIYGQDPTNGSSIDDSYTGANNQTYIWGASVKDGAINNVFVPTYGSVQTSPVLLPQGLTSGRDITGVNLFENVRKQGALNLDGNSWAEVHDNASLDLTTSLSLEVWCYPTEDGTSSGRELIGKFISGSIPYQCYALQYEPGKFGFGIGATDNTWEVLGSTTGKAKENWYHVVATYDGATRKIYINGVQDASGNYTKTPQTTDENIAIGRWLGQAVGGANTFFGPIAQPRIYNRALTASEVLNNYNATKTQFQ